MPHARAWVVGLFRMSRPLFLVGGVAFHALGIVLAASRGAALDWAAALWGQLFVTAVQLLTHYANEYFDLAADRAHPNPSRWAGGSRVLPEGLLPPSAAFDAAAACALLAALAAARIFVAGHDAPALVAIAAAMLILGWGYSDPVLRLESRGLGEFTVGVMIAMLTPLFGFALQAGDVELRALLSLLPLFPLAVASSIAVNFPDVDADRVSGRRTLVVRLGTARAARILSGLYLFPYPLLALAALAGVPLLAALAPAATAPLALLLAVRARRGDATHPGRRDALIFWTSGLLMAAAGLEGAAFLNIALPGG